jgi:Cu(I)/Ag(I) efflux system membrane fusion protein
MNKLFSHKLSLGIVAALIILSFMVGSWSQYKRRSELNSAGERAILYYVDPMHPSYKSDKPGIAPDCGMKLEPVYADGAMGVGGAETGSSTPGAVKISADRQQLIGVKVATVEKKPVTQTIRVLGRVAVDETRIYFINATIDGWISKTYPNATGSFVKKNEVLAAFYSPDFLSSQQAYLFALRSSDRVGGTKPDSPGRAAQLQQFEINLQQYRDSLRNLGMGETQIEKLKTTRAYMENVDITSPADGVILARGVSTGQRFEKGKELYRIADLSSIWILADIFENEAQFFKPGSKVLVSLPHQNMTFSARVSNALPQFDNVSRTLKVRLEVDNPDIALKPDMFVDIELPVHYPPTFTVPVDAVVDTGMRKLVFVDKGGGVFEPRRVDTGWRRGGLVEISRGLMNGERIVVSGTFMIDSESRMQAAAMGIYDEGAQDPVCGMYIDEKKARAAGRTAKAGSEKYYFCSPECLHDFEKSPSRYIRGAAGHRDAQRPKAAPHADDAETGLGMDRGDRMQYYDGQMELQKKLKTKQQAGPAPGHPLHPTGGITQGGDGKQGDLAPGEEMLLDDQDPQQEDNIQQKPADTGNLVKTTPPL